jgi:hypothetical protein
MAPEPERQPATAAAATRTIHASLLYIFHLLDSALTDDLPDRRFNPAGIRRISGRGWRLDHVVPDPPSRQGLTT